MNAASLASGFAIGGDAIPPLSRAMFAASYPEGAHKFPHGFGAHPLLDLDALANLAQALQLESVEYGRGGRPIGLQRQANGEGVEVSEAIRGCLEADSCAVLIDVAQLPAFSGMVGELLADLEPDIVAKTGTLFDRKGQIQVFGPHSAMPDHVDRAHTLVLQLAGEMAITVFPAGHSLHEASRTGGDPSGLPWPDDLAELGATFRLEAGEAIYVPATAPRQVRNGAASSVSLSISWRSEWSSAEADARAFNRLLRRWGLDPRPPGRWPARNRTKSIAWRALRRLPGID